MKYRWMLLAMAVTSAVAAQSKNRVSAGQRAALAFNGGNYNYTAIEKAIKEGNAVRLSASANETRILHTDITVFENESITTRAQLTLFVVVETRFYSTMLASGKSVRVLDNVEGKFVILDYQGRSTSTDSYTISFKGKKRDKVWTRVIKKGVNAQRFYDELAGPMQKRLALVSGFLEKRPGNQVVDWEPSASQRAISFLVAVVELIPGSGLIKHIGYEVAENAAKVASVAWLEKLAKDDKLRHGHATTIENDTAVKHAETFIKAGQSMWRKKKR